MINSIRNSRCHTHKIQKCIRILRTVPSSDWEPKIGSLIFLIFSVCFFRNWFIWRVFFLSICFLFFSIFELAQLAVVPEMMVRWFQTWHFILWYWNGVMRLKISTQQRSKFLQNMPFLPHPEKKVNFQSSTIIDSSYSKSKL